MRSAFISYGGPDEAFAHRLANALKRKGVKTFLFSSDAPPGERLHRVMREGVNSYERVILLCSRASLNRPGVLNELEEVLAREAREGGASLLIPIVLDDYYKHWAPARADLAQAVRDRVVADFRGTNENRSRFSKALAGLVGVFEDRSQKRADLWSDSPSPGDIFRLMSWRTRLTHLYGRDREMHEVLTWVRSGDGAPRVRVVTGPGGAGKTRLAAELCDRLSREGWSARFLEPSDRLPAETAGYGSLWVIDYPEEKQEKLRLFLESLRDLPRSQPPIRVLLLSRQPASWWQEQVDAAHSWHLFEFSDLDIGGLSAEDTAAMFHETCFRVGELYGLPVPEVDADRIKVWRGRSDELNSLPLFVVAMAVHTVLDQNRSLELSGPQVVRSLVRRERERLQGIGLEVVKRHGFKLHEVDRNWATRLRGLAVVAGEIRPPLLRQLAARELNLRLPPADTVVDMAAQLPFWSKVLGCIQAVRPDIFAAALLLDVLSERSDQAPEWLWVAIENQAANPRSDLPDRIARLLYDVSTISDEQLLSQWFVQMVEADEARARALGWLLDEERPPDPLLPLTLAIGGRLVVQNEGPAERRAATAHNYATHLDRAGRDAEALPFAREAVAIYEKLAEGDQDAFRRRLARAKQRLGTLLHTCGKLAEAVETTGAAVALLRPATTTSGTAEGAPLLHDLAATLNDYGLALAAAGRRQEAEEVYREEIEIYRNLAKEALPAAQRRVYEDSMARGLHNLSGVLNAMGRGEEAFATIRQAIEIRRRLWQEYRWRYAGLLALSLQVLTDLLGNAGAIEEAVQALEEVISLRKTLVRTNPKQFGPTLAQNLASRAALLDRLGRKVEALQERLAEGRLHSHLLQSGVLTETQSLLQVGIHLAGVVGYQAVEQNSPTLAIEACTAGIELLERIWQEKPALWSAELEYVLAGAYLNRGNAFKASERQRSIADYTRAIEVLEDLAQRYGFHADGAIARVVSLTNRAIELLQEGKHEEALRDWREAKQADQLVLRELGDAWPWTGHLQWMKSLIVLLDTAVGCQEVALAKSVAEEMSRLTSALRARRTEASNGHALIRRGDALLRIGWMEAGLALLLEGVAGLESLLQEGHTPTPPDSLQKSDLLNSIGYSLALAADITNSPERLPDAETYLRQALLLLPSSGAELQKRNTLDSLGFLLTLRAQRERSLAVAGEAVSFLREALGYGIDLGRKEDSLVIEEHLDRALCVQRDLIGGGPPTPPTPAPPADPSRAPQD